jgi:amino acid transporter
MAIVVPTDMSAAATILQFWDTPVPPAAWITIFAVFIVVLNFLGVKLFGEVSKLLSSIEHS